MKKYYKIYPQFNEFCKLISNINLEDDSDYLDNDRNDIYDRLRLPIRMFKGDKRKSIDNLIKRKDTLRFFCVVFYCGSFTSRKGVISSEAAT